MVTLNKLKSARDCVGKRSFPSDYVEMDGIIKNGEADRIALACIDAQIKLMMLLDSWEYEPSRRFSADAVKDLLMEIRVEV